MMEFRILARMRMRLWKHAVQDTTDFDSVISNIYPSVIFCWQEGEEYLELYDGVSVHSVWLYWGLNLDEVTVLKYSATLYGFLHHKYFQQLLNWWSSYSVTAGSYQTQGARNQGSADETTRYQGKEERQQQVWENGSIRISRNFRKLRSGSWFEFLLYLSCKTFYFTSTEDCFSFSSIK